ncbi:competence pheromone ComX [Paenibacillus tengchongensis]|uniref:competence pheromone ComX n=1 Tax=Paenibacillus tengchongensis TaxID=2608684 RepID=UPI001651CA21|nr:competence pheromone ComX [Paenibacillus tengchongensis]
MLKETVQKLMADPSMMAQVQTGEIQLDGFSESEQRAFVDVLNCRVGKTEPRMAMYWNA